MQGLRYKNKVLELRPSGLIQHMQCFVLDQSRCYIVLWPEEIKEYRKHSKLISYDIRWEDIIELRVYKNFSNSTKYLEVVTATITTKTQKNSKTKPSKVGRFLGELAHVAWGEPLQCWLWNHEVGTPFCVLTVTRCNQTAPVIIKLTFQTGYYTWGFFMYIWSFLFLSTQSFSQAKLKLFIFFPTLVL